MVGGLLRHDFCAAARSCSVDQQVMKSLSLVQSGINTLVNQTSAAHSVRSSDETPASPVRTYESRDTSKDASRRSASTKWGSFSPATTGGHDWEPGEPLHMGYLNKEGKSLLVKRWQQRFFALYETRLVGLSIVAMPRISFQTFAF